MKEKTRNLIISLTYSISFFYLMLIFINSVLSVLGFIVKIPITFFHFPLSLILTIILNYFVQKKYKNMELKPYVISVLIAVVGIIISLIIANMYMDVSYDGTWYHLNAIIRLKQGWNPIYKYINTGYFGDVFIDSYSCKAFWMFGASVYSFFGNIDSTKIISTIMMFGVLSFSISVFIKYAKNRIQLIFMLFTSFMIALNPVYISQIYTNYLDSTLGLLLTLYILIFISMYLKQQNFNNNDFCLLIIMSISIMMNIKLTGLFFVAIFCVLYLIKEFWQIYVTKNWKYFFRIVVVGIISLTFGFFIGLNPYLTNPVRGHHIFYPIFGEERIEVMGANVPEALRGRSSLEKLILANFSTTTNYTSKELSKLNKPFDFTFDNYRGMNQDTRVGGFGSLFSTILLITLVTIIINSKEIVKRSTIPFNNTLLISILIIFAVSLIFGESWWARYYVVLWLIPIFISIYSFYNKHFINKMLSILILIIMTINCCFVYRQIRLYNEEFSKPTMNFINSIENKNVVITTIKPDGGEFVFSILNYLKEHNINVVVDNENQHWDHIGAYVKIKVLD